MKKTLQELRAEQTALEGEMRQLFQAAKEEARDFDEAETVRFDDAAERLDVVKAEIAAGERRIEAMRNLADSGAIEHGTPGADPNAYEGRNLATNRGNTERDNAMRTIERGVKAKELPEHAGREGRNDAARFRRYVANRSVGNRGRIGRLPPSIREDRA